MPINVNEDSTCNIKQRSLLANLISKAKLIIWDKAPMTHQHCFEAINRTFRDILRFRNSENSNIPFGGKVVVFGQDFRQIILVIPKGTRKEVFNVMINSSYLWDFCEVPTLITNMRVGDEKVEGSNDIEMNVHIPNDLLLKRNNHILKIKVGVSIMLLRNIDQSSGLCNGRRLLTGAVPDQIEYEICSTRKRLLGCLSRSNKSIQGSCNTTNTHKKGGVQIQINETVSNETVI
uniref:ATP-dependent DNA helicase n=1 Tax=Cajanus cajan TaxID=3821 RepID=A0A151QWT7_CAJCA|nr:hypothetical protein KK1_044314 [Cajanus cajan]